MGERERERLLLLLLLNVAISPPPPMEGLNEEWMCRRDDLVNDKVEGSKVPGVEATDRVNAMIR